MPGLQKNSHSICSNSRVRKVKSVSYTHLDVYKRQSPYNVGLDAAIIMNPQTWVTTGHVSSFSDPLLDLSLIHI